mmetsp:Transcript_30046/g.35704  ORF Transcript_30046/g.35704 Transcript_30046/m.35704 type:complete len:193 (+) Transcript_30046:141-719(+)|eukprot:CAMPEP_0198250880 /NCGR_PEP_ID=MMETSP1447-20131203/1901_1 /TAXON_ID=420782 /ORGANISM="Chaetoceros dichaeta, Strain CCMP1751" /LENGTH=192 /DNA_ID=CAMNT_0043935783 /DNA_START=124 /DNA_END=702 /DNA_ORIENTATION=+
MSSGSSSPLPASRRSETQERNSAYKGNNNNNRNADNSRNNQWREDRCKNRPTNNRRRREDPYNMTRLDVGARGITSQSSDGGGLGPQRSVEGWIVFVTGLNEEAQEDDIRDAFSEYGPVKSVHVNLDLQTGFCKGYALIEYNEKSEAQDAINALHGTELLGKSVKVDWAFVGGGGDSTMGVEGVPRKKTKRR